MFFRKILNHMIFQSNFDFPLEETFQGWIFPFTSWLNLFIHFVATSIRSRMQRIFFERPCFCSPCSVIGCPSFSTCVLYSYHWLNYLNAWSLDNWVETLKRITFYLLFDLAMINNDFDEMSWHSAACMLTF